MLKFYNYMRNFLKDRFFVGVLWLAAFFIAYKLGFHAMILLLLALILMSLVESVTLLQKIHENLAEGWFSRKGGLVILAYASIILSIVSLGMIETSTFIDQDYQKSLELVTAIVAAVIACDSFSYLFGKTLGEKLGRFLFGDDYLLAPNISSKKTRIGAIGGALSGGLVFAIFLQQGPLDLFGLNSNLFGLGVLISAFSIVGDLNQSVCKRISGKKDSSSLLKGHGGFWDRTDALIYVFAFLPLISFITLGVDKILS